MLRSPKFIGVLICLAVCVAPVGILCAQNTPPSFYGGALVVPTSSDPKTFNEIVATETSSSVVTSLLFEGLTTVDPFTQQVLPNLAKRWDVTGDGLVWTFYLRPGVRFFDGVELTAADVVFTFNDLIYNPEIPSSAKDIFTINGQQFKVEAVSPYCVRFTLPDKFAPFLRSMSQPIFPKHKLIGAVRDKKFPFTWGINTPPREVIGTGPFFLESYWPGERLVFRRNPAYWKKSDKGNRLPYLDEVIYLIIPNPDTALLKFLDGELDVLPVAGKYYGLLKPLERRKNFTLYNAGADDGSNFLSFNQNTRINPKNQKPFVDPVKSGWFTDVRFRQAIAHAIDKKRLIEIIAYGLGFEQSGPMTPSSGFFYNPKTARYDYDLDKARQILSEAGYVDRDHDGVIEDLKGNPVEFTLLTPSGGNGSDRDQIAFIIQADLKQIGLKVHVQIIEFNALVSKVMSSFDWDAMLLGLTGGTEPHFGKNVWHSSGQLHLWNPSQEKPQTVWEERIDNIFNQGVAILDEGNRKKLYDEFQQIAAENLPVIYTMLNAKIYALHNRLANVKPSANAGVLHNIEEIYIADDKQVSIKKNEE